MLKRYLEYCKNVDTHKGLIGIPSIDESLGGIRPGELCGILGATNVGKTSLAMMSARATSVKMPDKIIPVICTEPTEIDMIERYLQIEFDMFTKQVESLCKDITFESEKGQELFLKLKRYDNIVHVVNALKENDIVPYIKMLEELNNKQCGFFVIDHIQGMKTDLNSNKTEKIEQVVSETKQAVNQLGIPALIVSHVNRIDAKGGLNIHSGKGSGEIENSCQILLSVELAEDISLIDYATQERICTEDFPHREYKLLEMKPLKKKRGTVGKTFLLQNTKTTEITEYSKSPKMTSNENPF